MLPTVVTASLLLAITQADAYDSPATSLRGTCPGGVPSLAIDCDPRHPWPRCPPQTYCYATGAVEKGPYYCCPSDPSSPPKKFNKPPSSIFATTPVTNFQEPPAFSYIPYQPMKQNEQFNSHQAVNQTGQPMADAAITEEQLRRIATAISTWLKEHNNIEVVNQ